MLNRTEITKYILTIAIVKAKYANIIMTKTLVKINVSLQFFNICLLRFMFTLPCLIYYLLAILCDALHYQSLVIIIHGHSFEKNFTELF